MKEKILGTTLIWIMKATVVFGILLGPLYIMEGILYLLGW